MTSEQGGGSNIWLRDWTTEAAARIGRWQPAATAPRIAPARRGIAGFRPTLQLFGAGRSPGRLLAGALPRGLPLVLRMRRPRRDLGRPMITAQSQLSVQTATALQRREEPPQAEPPATPVYEAPSASPAQSIRRQPEPASESVVARATRGVLRLLRRERPRGPSQPQPAERAPPRRTNAPVSRSQSTAAAVAPSMAPDTSAPAPPRDVIARRAEDETRAADPGGSPETPAIAKPSAEPPHASSDAPPPERGIALAQAQPAAAAPPQRTRNRPAGLLLSLRRLTRRNEPVRQDPATEAARHEPRPEPATMPPMTRPAAEVRPPGLAAAPSRAGSPPSSSPSIAPASRGIFKRAVAVVRRQSRPQAPAMELRAAQLVQRAATPAADLEPDASRAAPVLPEPSVQRRTEAIARVAQPGAGAAAQVTPPVAASATASEIQGNEPAARPYSEFELEAEPPARARPALLAAPALIYRTIARLRPRPGAATPVEGSAVERTPAATPGPAAPPPAATPGARAMAGSTPPTAAPRATASRGEERAAEARPHQETLSPEPAELQLLHRRPAMRDDAAPAGATSPAVPPSSVAPVTGHTGAPTSRATLPLRAFRRTAPPSRRPAPSLVYRAARPAPAASRSSGSTTLPVAANVGPLRNGHSASNRLEALGFGALPVDQAAMLGRTIAVQRAVSFEDVTAEAAPGPEAAPAGGEGAAPGGVPLEKLAQQVYEQLRRRLLIEHERAGLSRVAW